MAGLKGLERVIHCCGGPVDGMDMFRRVREHIGQQGPQKGRASHLLRQMFRQGGKIHDETLASISALPGSAIGAVPAGKTLVIQPRSACASSPTTTTPNARLVACRNPPWRVERSASARPCSRLPNASRPPVTAGVLTGADRDRPRVGKVVNEHQVATPHHRDHRHHYPP